MSATGPPIKQPIGGVRHAVAVASGKGGVGKTTVAVNLALALAQQGCRTGIFDADLYGPNVPLMLGIRRRSPGGGFIPVARRQRDPYIPALKRFGLQIMSIGLLMADDQTVLPDTRFSGHIIRQTIQDVAWENLDFLLVDFPPGSGEPQQTLLKQIGFSGVIIVTTPQDLSLLDSGRSLGLFRHADVPVLGVVENMSYLNCPHCGEPVEIFHRTDRDWLIEQQENAVLGRLPMDIAIRRGISHGHPLVQADPESAQANLFQEIARNLMARIDAT